MRCNNGVLNNDTGICECDEGWTSGEEDEANYIPSLSVYHMCNIKLDSWNAANMAKIRSTVLAFSVSNTL